LYIPDLCTDFDKKSSKSLCIDATVIILPSREIDSYLLRNSLSSFGVKL
jgi:hypothetical protein